ncbi:hypothetical protein GCM10027443_07020 [Pontibacter brevis]
MGRGIYRLVKGAIAGAVGVWLMDRFTWYWYSHEDTETLVQERAAMKGGRYAPNTAGKQLTDALQINLPQKQQYVVGRSIHYLMGIAPGALYAIWRHRVAPLGFWRGPLYSFTLFISFDEVIVPSLGYASEAAAYPWQSHARGFFAHILLGVTTDAVISLLDQPLWQGR